MDERSAKPENENLLQLTKREKRLTESKHKRRRSLKSGIMKRDTNILKANLNVLTPDAGDKTFSDFDIDERLLKAIGGMGWQKPTKVQEALVPLALEGKSVISRARTGSGKTGAYLIPIISKVVDHISSGSGTLNGPSAVLVAPTKELCVQALSNIILTEKYQVVVCLSF